MGRSCTLNGIQLKNVRSLKDTGMQQLAPITILVGENSSGKSTFLRTFPLLGQSIRKKTSGPILWAGDVDDYVDFGSFEETVTNDKSSEMAFAFTFDLDAERARAGNSMFFVEIEKSRKKAPQNIHVRYEITITKAGEEGSRVSKLHLTLNDYEVLLDILHGEICIGGEKVELSANKRKKEEVEFLSFWRDEAPKSIFDFELPDICSAIYADIESSLCSEKNTRDGERVHPQILRIAVAYIGKVLFEDGGLDRLNDRLVKNNGPDSYSIVKDIISCVKTIGRNLKKIKDENKKTQQLNKIKLLFVYSCFENIEEYLETYFRRVHYIAPVRATAERYYRVRNLAVDEVDHQGKNLPMVINSLPAKELKKFQSWTLENFGFKVSTAPMGGNLSLKISLKNSDKEINLSDTGFGYSQILPIITQIWLLSAKKNLMETAPVPLVVAIEQPELHLHPAMQARLAGAFIASIRLAKKNGYDLQFILETHSETIVNYFGHAISKGKIESGEVKIILFERDPKTNLTEIKNSSYDEDGFLTNWPTGFLAPRY